MELTFFAKLFGLYFVIVGIVAVARRDAFMPAVSQMVKNRALILTIALVELLAGLALVITRPDITFDWQGLVSLIGWMMIVEALVYLALPGKTMQKVVAWFNRPEWYVSGGVISILVGVYLAGIGFGLF